ncbi:MAG: ABC transporter permease [Balneolaceae bacterium]|nr:ABC transporter permease [Balneolaceae bacterium]MBO6545085.1 ABC transporter permease [Balneolaceae bacterium]MBO6646481.1 ABC transporter permease [Balneolaceae bacterium]
MSLKPPKYAVRFLIFFLKDELQEEVLGDLEEAYYFNIRKYSKNKAKFLYWYQVLNYLRPFAIRNFSTPNLYPVMFRHNLKISYRTLLKNKTFSLINIGGLALGMTVTIFIALWIYDEYSYNANHEHYDRIVQVMRKDISSEGIQINSSQTGGAGVELEETYSNYFEYVAMTFFRPEPILLLQDGEHFREMGYYFQEDIPHILSLNMIQGSRNALENPSNIIISESLASKIFNEENPMGKTISLISGTDLIVQGIFEDLPGNSTFGDAAFFGSMGLIYNEDRPFVWNNYNMKIFALLRENADIEAASRSIKDVMKPYRGVDDDPRELFLLPMKDWHFYATNQYGEQVAGKLIQFIRLYGAIGIFILLIACINFMNLNTSRFQTRGKEVGVRKAIGSVRSEVVVQYLTESLLYTFGAFIISLLLVYMLLPSFNVFAAKEISLPWINPIFWVISIGFGLLVALVAGSYPAVFLSSFNPVQALKGRLRQGKKNERLRQGLVVFQFVISIVLIIGTITIHEQIQYAKNRSMGYQTEGLITMTGSRTVYQNMDLLRTELKNTGAVEEVAFSNYPLTNTLGNNGGFRFPGSSNPIPISFNTIYVSPEYGQTTKFELVAGRDFSRELGNESASIIISESAASAMGLDNPVGQQLISKYDFNDNSSLVFTIVGVIKDMVKGSPFEEPMPLMLFPSSNPMRHMFLRAKSGIPLEIVLSEIEEVFDKVAPEHPFEYAFADNQYLTKFRAEEQTGTLATLFSALAILISCLGLFGLSAFMVTQRVKEIGIRKTLGASVTNLWALLSRDFGILVIIACIISIPIASFVMNIWLQDYEYRIHIYWWIYAIGVISCFLVTMLTVSYHSIKASLLNPVKSLKTE